MADNFELNKGIKATFVKSSDLRKGVEAALGFNTPSALDLVDRGNFKDDAEYIGALVETQKNLENRDFQRAARKVAEEQRIRAEKEAREAQRKEYAEIRGRVTLADYEVQEIDKEAARLAQRELALGKIYASELGEKIKDYADTLTEKKKADKAAGIQFNALFRKMVK